MLDIERPLKRSISLLVAFHITLTLTSVFFIESMLPKSQLTVATRLELRDALDALSRCVTAMKAAPDPPCQTQWQLNFKKAQTLAGQLGIGLLFIAELEPLSPRDGQNSPNDLDRISRLLVDLAQSYDREWEQATKGYRTAVLGGSWTIIMLSIGMLVFLKSFYKKIFNQLVLPFVEISRCLAEWKQGNRLRRCSGATVSRELKTTIDILNDLLDDKLLPNAYKRAQKPTSQAKNPL